MPLSVDTDINVSIVVTTYNRPDALKAVLVSLDAQYYRKFEVIIADDGSGKETVELIEDIKKEVGYPIIHAWQADKGFRAARARNMAVSRSSGTYLIFLDGDCIPLPGFIRGHLNLAEKKWFVRGNRIMLNEHFTKYVLAHQIDLAQTTWRQLLLYRLQGKLGRLMPLLRLPLGPVRKMVKKKWQGAKTCNLGLFKADFVDLNGFNEDYIGWGHEDADLVVRLIRSGIMRKEGNFMIPTFHLWHELNDRTTLKENEDRLQHILSSAHIRATSGLSDHLK